MLRLPDFLTTAQNGGRLSALPTGRLYPPGIFMVLFTRGLSIPQGHGLVGVTPPGIDPGTVRLVAQRLNHYATPGCFTNDTHGHGDVRTKVVCYGILDNMAQKKKHRLKYVNPPARNTTSNIRINLFIRPTEISETAKRDRSAEGEGFRILQQFKLVFRVEGYTRSVQSAIRSQSHPVTTASTMSQFN